MPKILVYIGNHDTYDVTTHKWIFLYSNVCNGVECADIVVRDGGANRYSRPAVARQSDGAGQYPANLGWRHNSNRDSVHQCADMHDQAA